MGGVRIAMMVGAVLVLSGCAGRQTRQELARLQSQVGLLDERISQLERTGVSSASSASFGETAPEGWTSMGATATPKSASSTAGTVTVGSASLPKPSTRQIQQALKNAGFYQGVVDGKMGPLTREAVKEFQRVNGLAPDGVAGRQTWSKLRAYAELSSSGGEANASETLK